MKQQTVQFDYENDFCAWALEQAMLLRENRFDLIDVRNIAEEIASMGRRERSELASRFLVLLVHLLKWQYQPVRRGHGWHSTILNQRDEIAEALRDSPSLNSSLQDPEWLQHLWGRAVKRANRETHLNGFPQSCPWSVQEEILAEDWLP
jgi:hypothetical protein